MVNDDFGDVYGVFFALTGQGYNYEELKDTADFLKRELLLVHDVASVEIWGDQQPVVELTVSRAKMAELGISMETVVGTLNRQNQVVQAGKATVDDDRIRISPTGEFQSVHDLGDLLVQSDKAGNLVYLKDLVHIRRTYEDPPQWLLRYNGQPALGLGIATVDGGNVLKMGTAVQKRIRELIAEIPVGMTLNVISDQADLVSRSTRTFLLNLGEAVAIVIIVLCVTMGLSSGALMGVILLLTILGTFMGMRLLHVDFQTVSLGALILALGMLVDNAIVVTEGILVRVQSGMHRKQAALQTVAQTAWPLLGATFVAVLAFAAIGTSPHTTGEFLKSLFQVMALSLGLSWVLAITLTPLFCVQFLPKPKNGATKDPYDGRIFRSYRAVLDFSLGHRTLVLSALVLILVVSVLGFTRVEKNLFPNDNRNQFMIHYWKPEGTHIQKVSRDVRQLEAYLAKKDEVTGVASFIGRGALRFVLTYDPEQPNSSYALLLVTVKDSRTIDGLIDSLRAELPKHYPDAFIEMKKFRLGPGEGLQHRGPVQRAGPGNAPEPGRPGRSRHGKRPFGRGGENRLASAGAGPCAQSE